MIQFARAKHGGMEQIILEADIGFTLLITIKRHHGSDRFAYLCV